MRASVPPSVIRLPVLAALVAAAACAEQPTVPDPIAAAPTGARFSTSGVPTTAVYNPANGHSYELIAVPAGSRWHEARIEAALRGGYLATLTSRAELDFVVGIAAHRFLGIYWLGGFQEGNGEPNTDWRWVTSEPWSYTNWNTGEPNNAGGDEDHLALYLFGRAHPQNGLWNDRHMWMRVPGYVVEYEPDATAPSVNAVVDGTLGNEGWYVSDVAVSWSIADAETPATIVAGCEPASVTNDTPGISFACDVASGGGRTSPSVQIKRDATAPTLTLSGNAGTYGVDQTVSIWCTASDAGSGVESSSCAGVSGPAYTFGPGAYTFSASVADRAGNQATSTGGFSVTVTTGGVCALVERFVSSHGIANALCQKLDNAAASTARGNRNAAQGQLGAFVNQLQAQSGKSISADDAAVLIRLAGSL